MAAYVGAVRRGLGEHLLDDLLPGSVYTGLQVQPLTPQLAQFLGVGGSARYSRRKSAALENSFAF